MQRYIFLKWYLLSTIISVGSVFLYKYNLFTVMWEQDSTMISSMILVIFSIMSFWSGVKAWNLSKITKITPKSEAEFILKKTERLLEHGWFHAQNLLGLGMLGTTIGFVMLFSGFHTVDVTNTKSMQDLLINVASGAGVALITTIVGLSCSILLKLQYFMLDNEVKHIRNNLL